MYRVLLADNDVLAQQALRIMIERIEGYEEISIAGSGEEAVRLCREGAYNVVFMNVLMPGITGLEAGRLIRQEAPDTAVYLMTAYPSSVPLHGELKECARGILEKPVTFSHLKDLLGNLKTESESSVRPCMETLLSYIRNRDFVGLYQNNSRITEELYRIIGHDAGQLVKVFAFVGQSLLDITEFYDDENRDIQYLFPLNEGLILDRMAMELWLFRVADYVFRKTSINRYPLLNNVFLYIENNIKTDISLNKIIENCAISQGYLSRIFKEQFQVSVMEYLHMRKVYLAKGYFYFTEDSIAEVAFRLGYNESSYFSKVFKKYENMTVKQYKNGVCEVCRRAADGAAKQEEKIT